MVKIKNLLLDRDGTIIVDKHYLKSPNEVELIPHAGSALQKFSKKRDKSFYCHKSIWNRSWIL